MRIRSAAATVLLVLGVVVAMPRQASAVTAPSRVALRGTGGYILGNENILSSAIAVTGSASSITVQVVGYFIDLAAPAGADLAVGHYPGATRAGFNTLQLGEPGISIFGNGRGCNTVAGEFWIDEITFAAGQVTSLAARFVHRCEGAGPPEIGWVSWNATRSYGWLSPNPLQEFKTGTSANVVLTNSGDGPLLLGTPALTGAGFSIGAANTCTGQVVAPRGTCTISVKYVRTGIELRQQGLLTVGDPAIGTEAANALLGVSPPPLPNNFAALRGTGAWIVGSANLLGASSAQRLIPYSPSPRASLDFGGYTIQLLPTAGSPFVIGHYGNWSNPSVDPAVIVYGNGRGCTDVGGEFWVDDVSTTDGQLTSLAARFIHTCQGGLPEYGWITWNSPVLYGWLAARTTTTALVPGASKVLSFTNVGPGALTLTAPLVSNSQFVVGSPNTCTGVSIASGGSCSLGVRYARTGVALDAYGQVTVTDVLGLASATESLTGDTTIVTRPSLMGIRGTGGLNWGRSNISDSNISLTSSAPRLVAFASSAGRVTFGAPENLTVGEYKNATIAGSATSPNFSITQPSGLRCAVAASEISDFFVDEVSTRNGAVSSFAAHFVHRCSPTDLPEYGFVSWQSSVGYGWLKATSSPTLIPNGVSKDITFTNVGNADLTRTAPQTTGDGFDTSTDPRCPVTLVIGATCTLPVRFQHAVTPSHFSGLLTISEDRLIAGESFVLDGLGVPAGEVVPIAPFRAADTRSKVGIVEGTIDRNTTRTFSVSGLGGVPRSGVIGVIANVTGVNASEQTYLTFYAADGLRPVTSNVNPEPGAATPNVAFIPVSADGKVSVYNESGQIDVLVDVLAWISREDLPDGGRIVPVAPKRAYDSRSATGPFNGFRSVEVRSMVPANASAVILNVTATNPTSEGWMSITAAGSPLENVSNLNFRPRQTIASMVISKMAPNGNVQIYNAIGQSDVIVDVVGYISLSTSRDLGRVLLAEPMRLRDTRSQGAPKTGTFGLVEQINGFGAVANVTVTQGSQNSYLTVWPSVNFKPEASSLNWRPQNTRANLHLLNPGLSNGFVGDGSAHFVVDQQALIAPEFLN